MDIESQSGGQLTADGGLRHLLRLEGLGRELIEKLLDDSQTYLRPHGQMPARNQSLAGRTVANLFFEPSTRTRASFELAAKRLSADVLNLDVNMSSRIKGESILDTIYTLQAMSVDVFVVRDASAGIPALIANEVEPHVSVLNAGEADVSHPTQGLLDLLTIRQRKTDFSQLTVTIVGDVGHSRVARSIAEGLAIMGVRELRLVSPPGLEPDMALYPDGKLMPDLANGLEGADVVMALRIQKERIAQKSGLLSDQEYLDAYGLTTEALKSAASDVIVMHPGPMNRGVEITGEVADGPQSVITRQVENGVAVRMAVLEACSRARAS